jgi:phosphatidate phosphatase APP1
VFSISKKDNPVVIRPYGGFANDTHLFAKARVLEDKGIEHLETDGRLRTLRNFYKRMGSDEKQNIPVEARWSHGRAELLSDREGYINMKTLHDLGTLPKENTWVDLEFTLNHEKFDHCASVKILRPGSGAEFALISDIDDTIIHTGVASRLKWKVLINSIVKNPFIRRPLLGVRDFYQALHEGKSGKPTNPVFYVSNSPWNLYSYLNLFLDHNSFPKGPLILRDIGVKPMEHTAHGGKYGRVKEIIDAFPEMKFVLSGDSAEVDTDIYLRLAREYPDQVHSIFIRTVKHKKRVKRVKQLIEANQDINVRLIRESSEGMAFAKKLDLL